MLAREGGDAAARLDRPHLGEQSDVPARLRLGVGVEARIGGGVGQEVLRLLGPQEADHLLVVVAGGGEGFPDIGPAVLAPGHPGHPSLLAIYRK